MTTGIPVIDVIVALGGLIIPPFFDFIKKKWVKGEADTPERTMASLATTKPESLPGYVEALSKYIDSQVRLFNRDVTGAASQWVVDLRACIRPITVAVSLVVLVGLAFIYLNVDEQQMKPMISEGLSGIRITCEGIATSWIGSRIAVGGTKTIQQ
jgi:hypothetical protein